MRTEAFSIYGQAEKPVELIPLRAGPLRLLYDPASGMVRRIKLGEREVLRGIYASVRDRNWGTVPAKIRETARDIRADSFRIEFISEHCEGEIDFVWRGKISGESTGELAYEFRGEARNAFWKNRIGFCVLHPVRECSGARTRQFRTDGSFVECCFPESIEPQIFGQSSFQNLRGVEHEISPNVWAQLSFEGDIFEMEDQRNWTDASFKTYCTPLALEFPVKVQAGEIVNQRITLKLVGNVSETETELPSDAVTSLTIPEKPNALLPKVGLGIASHGEALTESEAATLRQLALSHLRVDVRIATGNWKSVLDRAFLDAQRLKARLEVALHLPREGEPDFAAVAGVLESHRKSIARILVLRDGESATTPETLQRVRENLGELNIPFGAGSDCNFCELNREQKLGRFALENSNLIFWSINPQVHAVDHLSIIETLEAQTMTVQSARAFAGTRPLVISPVTLKQRFNPVATSSESETSSNEIPPQVDPRQLSHFAAAWTLGSIAALASAGVGSVTYFETTGWRGVMERDSGSVAQEQFPSLAGERFPVFEVLKFLAGSEEISVEFAAPDRQLVSMGLFKQKTLLRFLLANLTEFPQQIKFSGAVNKLFQKRSMFSEVDDPGVVASDQIVLRPYEIVRFECSE